MPKRKSHKSRRGGASAPPQCKSSLRTCMTNKVHDGASLHTAGKACMSAFNTCRTGGKHKKSRKSRR